MQNTQACCVCGEVQLAGETVPVADLRPSLAQTILKRHPDCGAEAWICLPHLNQFRASYIEDVLAAERGELSEIEEQVAKALGQQELLSENLNEEYNSTLSLGERVADKVAAFGGSWAFLGSFAAVLLLWIGVNVMLATKAFDPFPFILLNLILSCLASVQAPVIMMSQNRQEERDRLRAENDFRTNLKAELEVRQLHEKFDHLLHHQWPRLLEIQEMQLEIMEEWRREKRSADTSGETI